MELANGYRIQQTEFFEAGNGSALGYASGLQDGDDLSVYRCFSGVTYLI